MLPGISTGMLKKLKKKDLDVINEHIGLVKAAAKKKKDVLDGKFAELSEFLKHPKNEVEQLTKVIKDVQKIASSDLLSTLLGLEVNARELMRSIDEELKLIKSIENVKSVKEKALIKEIEGEVIIGTIVEHQIALLMDIINLTRASINQANELTDAKKRTEVGRNSVVLNNIANFLGRLILDEELPNLAITYNMVHLEEWGSIEKRIMEVNSRFVEIGQHLL